MATLEDIQIKVRRITRSPSESQISDDDLKTYINEATLYDLPEHLRLNTFKKELSFYTTPYVDVYDTNTIRGDDPLCDFKNAHITSHTPIYVAGTQAYLAQSRDEFYGLYPATEYKKQIGKGDGATTLFTGTLTYKPVVQEHVLFTSIDANDRGLYLTDIPRIDGTTGLRTTTGDLVWPDSTTSVGTINYKTGVYSFTFNAAPASGAKIYSQTHYSALGKPITVFYYDNKFTVRPVPDISYRITLETYVQPTAFDNITDEPELDQLWTYISYLAAKRIFEDRMDYESIQMIMPTLEEQENLCLRRTLVQNSNKRVATIYSQQTDFGYNNWPWNNNY